MDELQKLLNQIDDAPDTGDIQELEAWLKAQNMRIGKMQQRPGQDKKSERYLRMGEQRANIEAALKMLRNMVEREDSVKEGEIETPVKEEEVYAGLVAKGSFDQSHEEEGQISKIQDIFMESVEVFAGRDTAAQKAMYTTVSKAAEAGDVEALAALGYYYAEVKRDIHRAERLWHAAAEKGSVSGIAMRAMGCEPLEHGIYNRLHAIKLGSQRVYEGYEEYIKRRGTLDVKYDLDMTMLFWYYKRGFILDEKEKVHQRVKNTEKMLEELPLVANQSNSKIRNKYGAQAIELIADILEYNEKYKEAIEYNLKSGWKKRASHILGIYSKIEEPQIKKKLEEIIEQVMDDESMDGEVRAAIKLWYGGRYDRGEDLVKDEVEAFMNFYEAECLDGGLSSSAAKRLRIAKLEKARSTMDYRSISFLESIGNKGYEPAYEYLGDYYSGRTGVANYKKAMECYVKVQSSSRKTECKKKIDWLYERIGDYDVYNMILKQLTDTEQYSDLSKAFDELKVLAEKGLPEACLTIAEISEKNDKYKYAAFKLNEKLLKDSEIVEYYKKAGKARVRGAIDRLIEIYDQGLLGQRQSPSLKKEWLNFRESL